MNAVVDRIVQYANRYKLTDVSTGNVLGVFDFDEVTGTVQQVGTEINKELFDSIADDLATRLVANGGDSKDLIVTFTAATSVENISSKEKHSTIFGKIAKWFTDRISKLKKFTYDSTTKITSTDIDSTIPTTNALENGDITVMNAEYANSASRATADKNGKDITTYVATETDPTVPGWAKNATKPTYTKAEVGLGNVDNTADLDKPISTATQNALSAKVDKVAGKGLSTKDYTTAEKNKLAGLATDTVRYGEQSLTQAQKSQARSNIGAGTSNFDGTWGSLSGKPNVVQSTGNSTSDVMSQKAVTDELNEKANSTDLAQVATSGNYNDLSNKPTIPTNYVTIDTEQEITGKKTVIPPANKDNSNQIATTAWAGRRYKSIADFGFTSQTTVKAIVQKIIDNLYEYCTFACTNDNFNNFSDTPEGYGTLIIEVGSNALRPFISFTKQIGNSNSYKHWQANIVRGANNQVTEIQWYEIINANLPQTISGAKTFTNNTAISNNSAPTYSLIDTGLENGTNPTAVRDVQVIGRDKNNLAITGWRGWVSTTGYTSSHLYARSFGTNYSSFVAFYGKPNATANNNSNIWYFAPTTSNNIDLGASGQRWNNAYVKNIVADNIPFDSNGLSTGTLGSTKLPSAGRYYIECSNVSYSILRKELVSCVLDFNNAYCSQSGIIAVNISGTVAYYYYYVEVTNTGIVSITTYQASDNATLDSSGSKEITGTFKYKKLD